MTTSADPISLVVRFNDALNARCRRDDAPHDAQLHLRKHLPAARWDTLRGASRGPRVLEEFFRNASYAQIEVEDIVVLWASIA